MQAGSPPRMRGKQSRGPERFAPIRITPADAGKTAFGCLPQAAARDHPRGCGENFFIFYFSSVSQGSPPRMRGKLIITAPDELGNGITPADAGKTRLCNADIPG